MKQVFIKKGKVITGEVPSPIAAENEILVQVFYSCISPGTETTAVRNTGQPVLEKALSRPGGIKKALEMIRARGILKTVEKVMGTRGSGLPTGYSASGIVLEAGSRIKGFTPGDRVACAGAGIANHAQFISVPENLAVRMPEEVSFECGSTVALGSIAMQGVRRAGPQIGECVAVLGLGIIGQLTAQMLKVAGCRVMGADLDKKRIETAVSLGMDKALYPAETNVVEEARQFSGGYGADAVIITASSPDSGLVNQAMQMCRRKGKIIVVGSVGLDLKREEMYAKELDLLISTSYGPGRYDDKYELEGIDYPRAYVRWTENRNMKEYLSMIAEGKIKIEPLIGNIRGVDDAGSAFESLMSGKEKPLVVLLEYNREPAAEKKAAVPQAAKVRGKINVAVIGAGGFARGMHLPNLVKLGGQYSIYAVVDKIGSVAKSVAEEYGAKLALTDFRQLLDDKNADMFLVTTRHNLHAPIAIEAAKAGKAVFVEKPMAINASQLEELVKTLEQTGAPFTVGFNRRFSPCAKRAAEIISGRQDPLVINYVMNAGFIPFDSWVHSEEGGGRNIGEACHIYDLLNFLTGSEVGSVSAFSISPRTDRYSRNDNFVAVIKYADGSVCNLVYTALGTISVPKERMEIFVDGKIIRMNDYISLEVAGSGIKGINSQAQQKGHFEELAAFAESVSRGNGYSIPLRQLIQATEISFAVEEEI